MDDADRADLVIDAATQRAIERSRVALGSGLTESATECEDCGERIPEARRRAMPGCRKCVQRQMIAEQQT